MIPIERAETIFFLKPNKEKQNQVG